jgi:hypothetical protein
MRSQSRRAVWAVAGLLWLGGAGGAAGQGLARVDPLVLDGPRPARGWVVAGGCAARMPSRR